MSDAILDKIDAILGDLRQWTKALVVENGNRIAGPFTRHVPKPDEARVLCSHPFVLVVTEDGQPNWSYQAISDNMAALRRHTVHSQVICLTAEEVAAKRDWLAHVEGGVRSALLGKTTGIIKGEVWSGDTLSVYNQMIRETNRRLEAVGC